MKIFKSCIIYKHFLAFCFENSSIISSKFKLDIILFSIDNIPNASKFCCPKVDLNLFFMRFNDDFNFLFIDPLKYLFDILNEI